MKVKFISVSRIAGGAAILPFAAAVTTALAIEPPPDTAQPPAALLEDTEKDSPPDNQLEPKPSVGKTIPFLGLATAPLPEMVADHLGIEPGSSVIIRTVCPDSPAAKSGLAPNDIILRVNETAIGNPEALTSAIRLMKGGDKVAIHLIHKGKPLSTEVTLTERPADQIAQLDQEPLLDGIPKAHADRLRGLIEQNLNAFGNGNESAPDHQFENTFRQMRQRMDHAFENSTHPQLADGAIQFQQNSTVRMMDNEGSIEIQSSNGDTEVTVRDTRNEVLWSGPWDTARDKAAAPDDIRKRIDRINAGNGKGFSFRFGKPRSPGTIDN
ncbi:MAG: PDZ domain-containing protein [Armatimonadetes bacterium]|nr:PDZ domain-containing protein [Akkermansiaceae bacterium]